MKKSIILKEELKQCKLQDIIGVKLLYTNFTHEKSEAL